MEMKFNVQGAERKALVTAVSKAADQPAQYLGAPTFAYAVGDYHIDMNGALTGEFTQDFINRLAHFGYVDPDEVHFPEPPGTLTIEMPREGFTDESIKNLKLLIASKASLIKKSLAINDLTVETTDTTVQFPWFTNDLDSEKIKAYTVFIAALCNTAKNAVRVMGKDKEIENEKYNFRCFLLRLGFVGDDTKDVRKILLTNLRGDSSFKNRANRRDRATLYTGSAAANQETDGARTEER